MDTRHPRRLLWFGQVLPGYYTLFMTNPQLVDRTKELIAEGNVRRLIVRNQDDEVLLEVPLTTGVAVGGVVTLIAPVLAALGAMAALLTHVKVEIVRDKPSEGDEGGS